MIRTKLVPLRVVDEATGMEADSETRLSVQCARCKHYVPGSYVCSAFLGGIPEVIAGGKFDHRNPYNGDNGIQFERLN